MHTLQELIEICGVLRNDLRKKEEEVRQKDLKLQEEKEARRRAEADKERLEKSIRAFKKQSRDRVLLLEGILTRMGYRVSQRKKKSDESQPLFDYAFAEDELEESKKAPADEEEYTISSYTRKKKKGGRRGRKGLPAHLRREIKEYSIDFSQLPGFDPNKSWMIVDYDESEELKFNPAEFWVQVHRRPVVVYTDLEGESSMTTCGDPNKVFSKCMASPELLARIAVDRLDRALTLYRIERWFRDSKCPISRATLCYWMMHLGALLEPIVRAQKYEILHDFKIHTDDTNVSVLDPGGGSTKQAKAWILIGGESGRQQIVYVSTPARTKDEVFDLFGEYKGFLQVDACGVYDALFVKGWAIEVGCWSHVFRKFEDVCRIDKRARPMLRMIRELCDVEDEAKEMSIEQRKFHRLKFSWPILCRIKDWVEKHREKELIDTSFKLALNYVRNQWVPLIRYLQDGRLRMDNNPAEADFHVFGVTRRNHLFWSERGLPYGLILFGLIRTCRLHDIDPYEYLCDVITRVKSEPADQLTPPRWKEARHAKTIAEAKSSSSLAMATI